MAQKLSKRAKAAKRKRDLAAAKSLLRLATRALKLSLCAI